MDSWYNRNKEHVAKQRKEARTKNPDKYKEQRKAYYSKNKGKIKEKRKAAYADQKERLVENALRWKTNNPVRVLWLSAKHRALQKGLDFTIEMEDIVIPEYCPVLGTPMSKTSERRHNPSIDRLDSTKGYTKENIRIISYLANTMKNNATKEELLAFAKNIGKYLE